VLLDAFYTFAQEEDCASSTLITSPFESDNAFYEEETAYTYRTERIGQITKLPVDGPALDDRLMALFHTKTRNMIRKARKSGVETTTGLTADALRFLMETHHENMKALGGIEKPAAFFTSLHETFLYDIDWRLYTAYKDALPAAGLLLFYFNKTVEYYLPAIVKDYRTYQPLSLLVFEAMRDAARQGYAYWNWGGTWLTQDGVYQFKKRWGTDDKPYFYYTRIYGRKILGCSKERILASYPFFYVAPFSSLRKESAHD
jgi:hypothetical protein